MKKQDSLAHIRAYYDHNTPRFLGRGAQRFTRTIHRPVWGPGVQDESQALHYVHNLILAELDQTHPHPGTELAVADLGCDVGASLFYLLKNSPSPLRALGLTISPLQVRLAQAESLQRSFGTRSLFCLADFTAPPLGKQFDLVFSIEAFAHTNQPRAYFQAAACLLRPGGRLVVCDDFLGANVPRASVDTHCLETFRSGWSVPGVIDPHTAVTYAREAGLALVNQLDLTPYLRLRPLPGGILRLAELLVRTLAPADPHWRSILGGQALQLCLSRGLVQYRFLTFTRM